MLAVFDIGNTNIVIGICDGEEFVADFRLATSTERTTDEYVALLLSLLEREDIDPEEILGSIVSCVVPPLRPTFERLGKHLFGAPPLVVEPGLKTGMTIRSDNPAEVGADRIVNAVAMREFYGTPSIAVDFGTALTFDVVNPEGQYVGGIIAPGVTIAAEALFSHASRLYRVDIQKPRDLVGTNTVAAMQSGLFYGYVGMIDGILARLAEKLGQPKAIVATGGQAKIFAEASQWIQIYDPTLTLRGLQLIWELNN